MAQIKVFGIKEKLNPIKTELSQVIYECVMEALHFPKEKRIHRFFPMEKDNLLYPKDRTTAYTIIEISMMAGRTKETKKRLIRLLFDKIQEEIGIKHQDLEISMQESPTYNWGFRSLHGDEVQLDYALDV